MIPRTIFSEEHELYREAVGRFIDEEIMPNHPQWEKDGMVSREIYLKAGEQGFLCSSMPEEYGGSGADFLYSVVLLEELSRRAATGPGFHIQSEIIAPYVLEYGTEEQKTNWIPKLASGEWVGAIGMSEPGAGSDVANIRTQAVRDGDDYVINGQKVFISNGQLADLVILACKTDKDAGAKGISLIGVEATREGFTKGRNLDKLGFKAQDTSELFFDNVRVPVSNLIGVENRGFIQLMQELPQERLLIAIRATATLEAALQWTIDYTTERKVFGQTIASFQNTRFKLADAHSQIVMLRVFTDHCIALHVKGELTADDAALLKLQASEMQWRLLDDFLQLFGGYGYMWEYPICRALADARVNRIAGGSTEIMKEIIGRTLVGRS